jgi:peptidyl-prolyl cis-trans isomerase D
MKSILTILLLMITLNVNSQILGWHSRDILKYTQSESLEYSRNDYGVLTTISFETDTNSKAFVARNLSSVDFVDEYLPKSKINNSSIDTLAKLPAGVVYGPYVDKGNYLISKLLGVKQLPDSVKARHILIGTIDPSTGKEIMSDSSAKKLADSIYNVITNGGDFTSLALQYSSDQGSKIKGGDLGIFGYGTMVTEFNDFCFNKTAGSKGVVKTQFGYHIIDVVSQKDFKPAYKIASVGKEIIVSDETVGKSSLEATKASAEKTKSGLEKFIEKNGKSLNAVPSLVKENDYSIGALKDARSIVKWAFEAKVGDVSEPFSLGDQFVVVVLDKVFQKGTQDTATARSGCEAIIRNKKKAEIIIKKIGQNPTLESAASAYVKTVQMAGADSTIYFNSQIINGVGMESKMIGAAFNKTYQTKASPAIEGTSGVYLIKINTIQTKPASNPEIIAQNAATKLGTIRSQINGWYEGLKKQADIVDERSKHF